MRRKYGMADILENILDGMNDPRDGLQDEIFHFIRRVTPLINVDLLIRCDGRTLLAWREDEYDTGVAYPRWDSAFPRGAPLTDRGRRADRTWGDGRERALALQSD